MNADTLAALKEVQRALQALATPTRWGHESDLQREHEARIALADAANRRACDAIRAAAALAEREGDALDGINSNAEAIAALTAPPPERQAVRWCDWEFSMNPRSGFLDIKDDTGLMYAIAPHIAHAIGHMIVDAAAIRTPEPKEWENLPKTRAAIQHLRDAIAAQDAALRTPSASEAMCACAATPPTYPVFRDEPHLPGCREGQRLALEAENHAAIEDAARYALEANQEMENAAAWRRRAERWRALAGYYRRWAHAEYVNRTGESLPSATASVYALDRRFRREATDER